MNFNRFRITRTRVNALETVMEALLRRLIANEIVTRAELQNEVIKLFTDQDEE